MGKTKTLPPRSKVKQSDRWDLSSLFANDEEWEKAFQSWEKRIPRYEQFRGTLKQGPEILAKCFKFDSEMDRAGERLGIYAFLKTSEDVANSTYQGYYSRFRNVASRAGQAASFIRPEILAIPLATLRKFRDARQLSPYRILLDRLIRQKPHTLSAKEEKLLAMQSEMAATASRVFDQLNDADLKFGTVKNEQGESIELSHSSYSLLMHCSKRPLRKSAFEKFYREYQAHENTLAATLSGSIQTDIFLARARDHESSLAAALFDDDVPVSVYDNLIRTVRDHLPSLFQYFELRRRAMRLREIHHYDTYVPVITELQKRHTWKQAVQAVVRSLEPLGSGYCQVVGEGLLNGWCDRYENKGKRSGAFSCGSYDGDPYILMNYQPDVLDHVFTLTHEAGHSMHSFYSSKHQPFEYYNYTIFVAEVASTFNEQLLSHYFLENARSDKERAYFINREIDDIRMTVIRQTMFAEFEKITHEMAEANEPLTVESLKSVYWKLLQDYFGPDFTLDEQLKLEGFRIPHFYRAFYVYKYATGMSAAIALSERVLKGGRKELNQYLGFLKGGCSQFPLELLRDAGVDMAKPEPVDTALKRFGQLVKELDELV